MASHSALENTQHSNSKTAALIRACEFKPPQKPNDLRFQIRILNDKNKYEIVTRTGRDVVDATLRVLSWFARVGVPVQTSGRPSAIEPAKGGLFIIGDPERLWDHEVGCLVCVCVRTRACARIVVPQSVSALMSSWGVTEIVAWTLLCLLAHYTTPHNNRSCFGPRSTSTRTWSRPSTS